ncbi:uncharacterized protein LOC110344008 [Heterocephalus glaber]|uniref:Uncharacterized protein LOC110344008 n=1 Tax=Heterocephalus glaber TaxID=10181 RepID=A0AAX6R412_HETGA|nr:uncharacterized protein LOC110344008 [Heterocephalus glaber]XP_021092217.1 uncharacterized protein LOC110344008 [Heterocephalus glaber]XP_021092218.1 uncharacterized protein LOC110344008 [Heterocephalus glaber]XP_021092219.1 uncharacterized protein LOC110344008 [Heterocephalus glaber]XP_021092220.1 uncharacterized protein LOC110344008 [Heterocephalus glaber]
MKIVTIGGTPSYSKPKNAIKLYTPQMITLNNIQCAVFKNCTTKCLRLKRSEKMTCYEEQKIIYSDGHVPLPSGWFYTCEGVMFNYIPAYLSETRCCLIHLAIILPDQTDLIVPKRIKHWSPYIEPGCDDDVGLLTDPQVIPMIVSVLAQPATGIHAEKVVQKLSCKVVKGLNATSSALALINQELQEDQQAMLDNRAAIDYLLLFHHLGCEKIKNMCCFNMTDNSPGIQEKIKQSEELTEKIHNEKLGWDLFQWLIQWLPNMQWLKQLFLVVIIVIICLLLSCCGIQCLPYCMYSQRFIDY